MDIPLPYEKCTCDHTRLKKEENVIIELRDSGWTYQEIGDLYDVTRQRICNFLIYEVKKREEKKKLGLQSNKEQFTKIQ